MATYTFQVKELERDGHIAWDAVDEDSGASFALNKDGYLVAGTFPEIAEYLKKMGVDVVVAYDEQQKDSLRNGSWTFVRGEHKVVVKDIPRTVFSITWAPSPYEM